MSATQETAAGTSDPPMPEKFHQFHPPVRFTLREMGNRYREIRGDGKKIFVKPFDEFLNEEVRDTYWRIRGEERTFEVRDDIKNWMIESIYDSMTDNAGENAVSIRIYEMGTHHVIYAAVYFPGISELYEGGDRIRAQLNGELLEPPHVDEKNWKIVIGLPERPPHHARLNLNFKTESDPSKVDCITNGMIRKFMRSELHGVVGKVDDASHLMVFDAIIKLSGACSTITLLSNIFYVVQGISAFGKHVESGQINE